MIEADVRGKLQYYMQCVELIAPCIVQLSVSIGTVAEPKGNLVFTHCDDQVSMSIHLTTHRVSFQWDRSNSPDEDLKETCCFMLESLHTLIPKSIRPLDLALFYGAFL